MKPPRFRRPPSGTTKVIAVGDELGIILDKKLAEQLGFALDTELVVTVDRGCLLIARAGSEPYDREPPERPELPDTPTPTMGFPKKQPW
jgi:hypothetical protein